MIGFGRYNLLLKLGQGGMGAVYLARQKSLRRFCAIKVINPQFSQDKAAAERFLREAHATAALTHPNLVSIHDCDQFEGQYFIVMEYVEGMSLGEILRGHGAIPLPLALHWLNQAAVGLEYAHGKNIIHRDIKPDNLIADAGKLLKIMDLGLAKDLFETEHSMTVTGAILGSPHYMSPEQINDSKSADHRTDLYSLGISFYQMVVGKVPFARTSIAAICLAHIQDPVPSVGLPDAELTEALDGLVVSLTAKDRTERMRSASDLVAALGPWLARYPLDDAAQQFLGGLGFEAKKVSCMLESARINPAEVDADLPSGGLPGAPPPDTLGALEPRDAAPARTGSPSPQASAPARPKWGLVAAVVAALVLVLCGVFFALGGKRAKPPEQVAPAARPPVQQASAPAPTPAPAEPTKEEKPAAAEPVAMSSPVTVALTGTLVVESPKAGVVTLDAGVDREIGANEAMRWEKIRIGSHIVRMVADGKKWEKTVEVNKNETTTVTAWFAAAPGEPLVVDLGKGVKLELVWIAPGEFDMGLNIDPKAKPVHRVKITKGFWLGKYEVTQEQWQAIMGNNPSHFKGAKNPVEQVKWDECQNFLAKLNEKVAGLKFSLPTEAQWEYASRAGSTDEYCFGNDATDMGAYAWYSNNANNTTHPVGEKKPNAWGLYDMHGNVWEWCADWFANYQGAAETDPTGAASGSTRVIRGAAWPDPATYCRCAGRGYYPPSHRDYGGGLRVVVVVR